MNLLNLAQRRAALPVIPAKAGMTGIRMYFSNGYPGCPNAKVRKNRTLPAGILKNCKDWVKLLALAQKEEADDA